MTSVRVRPLRHLLTGQAAIPAAVLLMLALVAGLTYHTRAAERSHRATAVRALRDYSAFAAWEFTRRAEDLLDARVGNSLMRAHELKLGAADALPPASLLFPDSGRCGCGFGADTRFAFRLDVGNGALATFGTIAPATRAALIRRQPLFDAAVRAGVGRRDTPADNATSKWARLLVDTLGGETFAIAYTVVRDRAGAARAVYGVGVNPEPIRMMLHCAATTSALLPPSLVGTLPNDSVLYLRVARAGVGSLFAFHGPAPDGYLAVTDTMPAWLGSLVTTVDLRPGIASSLIIGGLPSSRLPMMLALLGIAVLLAVVALVQLWRGRELTRLRSQFVANVSHELRTPLAQISMFSETLLLERERSPAERQHFLSVIFREAGRLASLVESVLRFSHGEAGARWLRGSRLRLEPRDISDDVREALHAFTPLAAAAGVAIEPELADDAIAMADPGALRQIVLNLLDNAIKYGPREQTVAVRVAREDEWVVVSVADQGEGIPAGDRQRAFDPFVRIERPGAPRVSGTGIGLAVVRDLVATQGGRVWLEDARPALTARRGTRVVFTLPAAPVHETARLATEHLASAGATSVGAHVQ